MSIDVLKDNKSIQKILNVLDDGLYFSDEKGTTIWLNNKSEEILNKTKDELIGRNVWDLEKEGIMNPSITRMVLEAGKPITTVQSSSSNRQYFVSGHKIDIEGETLIIVYSRDITNNVAASLQLQQTERLLQKYSQEVRKMQVHQKEAENGNFLGSGPLHRDLSDLIDKVAEVDTTVLITGETGVGKNVVAERIHDVSDRYEKPFIHVNCGAIPETLIESELFGYAGGAFTGASARGKTGMVQLADKGTLFLDEIGELPAHLQPKLLQLLQNKSFVPVGETTMRRVDTRIVAATNRDLKRKVADGEFREDLYYRLNVLPIHVPPLRERKEDIFALLQANLSRFNNRHKKSKRFSGVVLDHLQQYNWPGNIRELENVVERLVITSQTDTIEVADLPEDIKKEQEDLTNMTIDFDKTLSEMVEQLERKAVTQMYEKHQSTRKAAKALGISQSAFMRRWHKYREI